MPIGSQQVYNSGDLILSTVSSSGTTFREIKIAAATSSIILFDNNGTLTSQSLSNVLIGSASYVSGSRGIITNLTASNISASGYGLFENIGIGTTSANSIYGVHCYGTSIFVDRADITSGTVVPILRTRISGSTGTLQTVIGLEASSVANQSNLVIGQPGGGQSLFIGSGESANYADTLVGWDSTEDLFFGSDNGFKFVTNLQNATGSYPLSINASGSVRIYYNGPKTGYTNPSDLYALQVIGDMDQGLLYLSAPSSSNAFYVSSSGRVGIGTTNPIRALHVIGDITASGITASLHGTASWAVSSSAFNGTASWANSASNALSSSFVANAFLQGGNSFGTTAIIGTNDANSLALETSGSTRLTINSGGKIGVGISPSSNNRFYISDTHLNSEGSSSLVVYTTMQSIGTGSVANNSGIFNYYEVNEGSNIFTGSNQYAQIQAAFNQLNLNLGENTSGSYRSLRNNIAISSQITMSADSNLINGYFLNQWNAHSGSSSIPNSYGILIQHSGNALVSGSIGNFYSMFASGPSSFTSGAFTISTTYGLYIDAHSLSNVVNRSYGIYQNGASDINIFRGNTSIDTTSIPSSSLFVGNNLSVGSGYANVTAPTNGMAVQGDAIFGVSSSAGYTVQIGQNVAGDTTNYQLGIQRNGTTGTPGTYQTKAIELIDFAGDGPSTVDSEGIVYIYSGRIASSDVYADNASLLNVRTDTGGVLRASGKQNVFVGYTTATTSSLSQSLFCNGRVGIGVTNPTQRFEVAGNISASVVTSSLFFGTSITASLITASSGISANGYTSSYNTGTITSPSQSAAFLVNYPFNASSLYSPTFVVRTGTDVSGIFGFRYEDAASTTQTHFEIFTNPGASSPATKTFSVNGLTGMAWANEFTASNGIYAKTGSFNDRVSIGENNSYEYEKIPGLTILNSRYLKLHEGANNYSWLFYTAGDDGNLNIDFSGSAVPAFTIGIDKNVGIGLQYPTYKLHVSGSFAATTKSFVIDHPTKPNKKLVYGALESPYHGIRLTGKGHIKNGFAEVELPEYICKLVRPESVNIQLTPIKCGKIIYVGDIYVSKNRFNVECEDNSKEFDFFWDFTGTRTDVEELQTEI